MIRVLVTKYYQHLQNVFVPDGLNSGTGRCIEFIEECVCYVAYCMPHYGPNLTIYELDRSGSMV